MSQKINPNSLRLGVHKSWESIWFSDPTKRKQSYTKLLHEDLVIQNYLKGLFWMFDIYQSQCFIERKPNGSVRINVHLYKHQKGVTLTPKEKILKEGLNMGWIPFMILKTIGVLQSKTNISNKKKSFLRSASNLTLVNLALMNSWIKGETSNKNIWTFLQHWPNTRLSKQASKVGSKYQESKIMVSKEFNSISNQMKSALLTNKIKPMGQSSDIPKSLILNTLLGNQDMDKTKYDTEVVRFERDWSLFLQSKQDTTGSFLEVSSLTKNSDFEDHNENDWWFPRQWDSSVFINANQSKSLSLIVKPMRTMAEDPQLIADYLATKIELSTPIQTVFNEIIRIFEQEVQCIGPDFEIGSTVKHLESDQTEEMETRSEVLYPDIIVEGFKFQCSGRIQVYPRSKPAEKAESIQISRGNLPLNTVYENIKFAQTSATNDYGTCGIKIWVNYASK